MFRIFTRLSVTVACCLSSVALAQPTLSAPVVLSTASTDSTELKIALSSDGTKATAVWLELGANNKRRVKTSSATIASGVATWGSVAFLSAADTHAIAVKVHLSLDGSQALAAWTITDQSLPSVVESSSATIVGNTASWGGITRLSRTSSPAFSPRIALSADGTRAFAVWLRNVPSSSRSVCDVVVGSSASVSGNTASWGSVQQISEQGGCVQEPELGISSSGGQATAVWSTIGSAGFDTIRTRTATISGTTASWGSITDLSAPGFQSKAPTVVMSADGTKATVAWARANVEAKGRAGPPILIRSRSATINGNTANWGATTVLSSKTDSSAQPLLGLSSDGSRVTASWIRTVGATSAVESSSATVNGNVASWGPVTSVSGSARAFRGHSLAVSTDGSKALSTWSGASGRKLVVKGASATIGGVSQLWGSAFTISDPSQTSVSSSGATSADGAVALLGWHQNSGTGKFVALASVAEFVHPTPTPTPIATNTPTATPTPAPTTTPVGTLSATVLPPSSASNDHHVVLRVKDYPNNFGRDYYGYLLRASDYSIVKMGKFKVRNHQGRLEFHDVPPGTYRAFTVLVRTKAPKIVSSRQRTITVK